MLDLRRRQFITLLGGAATWPLAVRAQQMGKLPTIGFLGNDAAMWAAWTAAFIQRLRELGWIDGRTITVEYRWSEGRPERVAEIAAEFIRLNVDLIVSYGTAVPTLKQATSTIPTVFAVAIDPLGAGLVTSLARPGGNVTGLSSTQLDIASKRLEMLREVVPSLHRFAIMFNASNPPAALEMEDVFKTARGLGLEIAPLEIRRAEDIGTGLTSLNPRPDALYVVQEALTVANRSRIITFALAARLPTISATREFVQAGALIGYGPNYPALFRRAAEYVDKILRGAKPQDIPVEQPTKYDLVVNLTTAKALGLTIPESFLVRADEIIE
jgi:ABC-type uncharacterized transport system substrate-binding protein